MPNKNGSEEEKKTIVLNKILQYWTEFLKSEWGQKNPLSFFQTMFRNQYICQDFQKMSKAFFSEIHPYKSVLRDISENPQYGSVVLITHQEHYFNLPLDFLRFQAILGTKNTRTLLRKIENRVKNHDSSLESVMGFLNRRLYEGNVRLTKTELRILRVLSRYPEDYFRFDQTVNMHANILTQYIRVNPYSLRRSLRRMAQLGVLKYITHIDYTKLGLKPYLGSYPSSFRFSNMEEDFIEIKVSKTDTNTNNFVIIMIPPGLEDRLAQHIQLIPLKRFHIFWDFTGYGSKMVFPKILKQPMDIITNPEKYVFPKPLGISIDYQDPTTTSVYFNKIDLEIIYELTFGKSNQKIAERLEKRGYQAQYGWTRSRTNYLLQNKVLYPNFYTAFIGVPCHSFVYAEGSNKNLSGLERILRFMISARHHFGTKNGHPILFSIIRLPTIWLDPFYKMMHHLRTTGQFKVLKFGWFPWEGAYRRLLLARLWNEEERYWNFPYHSRLK
ncbi:MAG: hypothetical protein ACFFC7_28005 [Candidatus Hermodarchaeota archaeon]